MARYISNIRGKLKNKRKLPQTNIHIGKSSIGNSNNRGSLNKPRNLEEPSETPASSVEVQKYCQVEGQNERERERERDMTWQTFITTFVGGIRPCQCLARLIAGCTRVYYIHESGWLVHVTQRAVRVYTVKLMLSPLCVLRS